MKKNKDNCLVSICGPSLGGKSILANMLVDLGFNKVVTSTTRAKREGEINEVSYFFLSKEEFERDLSSNNFVEHAVVNGNFYGTSKKTIQKVLNEGNCVIALEPQGAKEIRRFCEEKNISLVQVFLNNTQEELLTRFLQRFKDDKLAKVEDYKNRLLAMLHEEPKNWIEPAFNGTDKYDLLFDSFGKENERAVIDKILETVQNKLEEKKSPKQLKIKF